MKKYMELYADFKKTCDNEYLLSDYKIVCEYIDGNFEVIQKIKNPLTGEKFTLLYYKYNTRDIINKLVAMENHPNAEKKYNDVGWTLKTWLYGDKTFDRKGEERSLDYEAEIAKKLKKEKKKKAKLIRKKYQKEYKDISSENPKKAKYKKMVDFICDELPHAAMCSHILTFEQFEELYRLYPMKTIKKGLKEIDTYKIEGGLGKECDDLLFKGDFDFRPNL